MARFSMQMNDALEKTLKTQMAGLGLTKVQAINAIMDMVLNSDKLQGKDGEPAIDCVREELEKLNRILGKG